MSNVYLKTKDNLARIVLKNIILLLPIICYGIYKNGYLLFRKNIIPFIGMFKILYLIFIGLFIDILLRIIFKKKLHFDLDILAIVIIPLFMPYNMSYIVYSMTVLITFIVYEFLRKVFNINKVVFSILILYLVTFLFEGLTFLNPLEEQEIYLFNTWDLICGRNIGGIGSTSVIFGIFYLFVSSVINNYKWSIPLSAVLGYIIVSLIINDLDINIFINGNAILALFIVAPFLSFSPNRVETQVLYGTLIGIASSLFITFIDYYYGVFLGILLINILYLLIIAKKENILVGNK